MALTAVDRILLQRCLKHEPGAWNEFVDRFLGLIYYVIRSTSHQRGIALGEQDEEDIAAEILLTFINNNFATLRHFRGHCSLPSYLTVVARRVCVHKLLKHPSLNQEKIITPEQLDEVPDQAPTTPAQETDNLDEVRQLLEKLPGRDRQIVRMFYIEGRTYDEISEELNIPRNSIGPILSRVRNSLSQDSNGPTA